MKINRIKACDPYETPKYMHVILLQVGEVNKESFRLLYCYLNLHTLIHNNAL